MVLSQDKLSIFRFLFTGGDDSCRLLTVNKRIYTVVRTTITILIIFLYCGIGYSQYRTLNGSDNHPEGLGAKDATILRKCENAFEDQISIPNGETRANPRSISNIIFAQDERVDNSLNLSDYVWAFGQFLDHDISQVENSEDESLPIVVPENDLFFEEGSIIPMNRSEAAPGTGIDASNPRNYNNKVTSFIDGSAIYGSDNLRADALRNPNSTKGKLWVSNGNLLPWNTNTGEFDGVVVNNLGAFMENPFHDNDKLFLAGDLRANENPLLIAIHTLFVREHNRLCDLIAAEHPGWSSDLIYETARKKVGAYIQAITYFEWLPAQGIEIPAYNWYNDQVDPSIFNVFSSAAFRMGHTLINSSVVRMENDGGEISDGNIALKDAYFNPTIIPLTNGIEPYLKGMATNLQQDFDCKMIDDLRNFLFADPANGIAGLDLAAININRGRERGLPDYNTVRSNFGLTRIGTFEGITGETEVASLLSELYNGDVNNIDPWVGMLSEQHKNGALFGELVMTILEEQFQALRDGDRFYFENDPSFTAAEIEEIKNTTLHDIIMRNSSIELMQDKVFEAMPHSDIPNGPDLLPLQLEAEVYPNPAENSINVKYYMELAEELDVKIYNNNGQMILSTTFDSQKGENFMSFDLDANDPRGMYNIKIESASGFKILRFIKK